MTHLLSTLKASGRAAIVAIVLAGSAVTAMPAMAQSQPSFNFQFGVGPDGKPSVGFGVDSDGDRRGGRGDRYCMTERQVIRGLRDEGYRDIEIVRELPRNRVGVIAREGRAWYSMRVNLCTGEVDRVERLRTYRPGVRFQFNF